MNTKKLVTNIVMLLLITALVVPLNSQIKPVKAAATGQKRPLPSVEARTPELPLHLRQKIKF